MTKQWLLSVPIICGLTLTGCGGGSSSTPANDNNSTIDESTLTLDQKLRLLPGLQVRDLQLQFTDYAKVFELKLTQPIDHNNPSNGSFVQTAYLLHNDSDLPMLMRVAGGSTGNMPSEVSLLIGGNQLSLGHRYYPGAVPSTVDWEYLTAEQQSADLHAFRQLLAPFYPNQWAATGYGPGGEAALQYNYYYPDDLDATLVYSTTMYNSQNDTRVTEYLSESVSTSECRDKVSEYQRLVLTNKSEILNTYALNTEEYDMPLEKAIEYAVVQYPGAYWADGRQDCDTVPDSNASIADVAAHLAQYNDFVVYTTANIALNAATYVKRYNEAGAQAYKTSHLSDLMDYPDITPQDFAPEEGKGTYDPTKAQAMTDWLTNQGQHIIYVYGGMSPSTQIGFAPDDSLDSFAAINPDAAYEVNISEHPQKEQIHAALESWLNIQLP